MAVYKIFPSNDSFIFTEKVTGNAGLDEILEVGGYPKEGIGQTSRALIKFNTAEIQNVLDNKIAGSPFSSSLKLYLATASELPQAFTVYSYPLYDSYINGVGKFNDVPTDTSGVSWTYPQGYASTISERWTTGSAQPAGVTSSYGVEGSLGFEGGGSWYTGSNSLNLEASQSFNLNDNLDLSLDVTNATTLHYSGSIDNNGFIVKIQDNLEFYTSASIRLKYYGRDTHTIYPPSLEFKWDDSSYATGSLNVLSTEECFIDVSNNKGKYVDEGKQRLRIKARPKYPTRTFTTGSSYTVNYALPEGSTWGLKDEFTEEMIIPFDSNFTKISCDSAGPFFDLYLDGIQPERYYRVLVKAELDGTNTVIDNNITFKVVRNG